MIAEDTVLELRSTRRPRSSWHEIWAYRGLLRSLALRNLKVKYQRSLLGFVWTLLNPLLTLSVLIVVFTHVVKMPVPHYWSFLLSGWFVWSFLLQMLTTATWVMAEHAGLRRSVAFPGEVLVLASAASRMVEFAFEMGLVILILAVFHHGRVPPSFALLPLLIVLQVLLALGLAMPLAVLSVYYADVQHALPIVLMMLFYVSPIFYPAWLVPEGPMRRIYLLNPVADLLTLFQRVLYEGEFPSAAMLGGVTLLSVLVFFAGHALFARHQALLPEIG
jgi:ABC-type polysaccharide/polyol phosphate export permease